MEILLELVIQILGQFILEILMEGTFRGVAGLLLNRVVRGVLGAGLALAAGYACGYWWGSRLTELGRTDPPTSLWISIGLATLFLTIALVQGLRGASEGTEPYNEGIAERMAQWRWSVARLSGDALLTAAAAAGVAAGVAPRPLG